MESWYEVILRVGKYWLAKDLDTGKYFLGRTNSDDSFSRVCG